MLRTFWKATALATAAVMVCATAALADNVQNDVATSHPSGVSVVAGDPDSKAKVGFKIHPVPNDGETGGSCNLDSGETLTLAIDTPTGVNASPSSISFGGSGTSFVGCDTFKYVDFSANSSGVSGEVSVSITTNTTGSGTYNLSPAKFNITVTSPPPPPSDTTAPVITPNVSGTLGNNGWYVSNVTVSWTVEDNESAISSTTGCGSTTINADTAGTTLTCSATSAGGTDSKSVTIKRDATAPVVSCIDAAFLLNESPASVSANVSDATSGALASPISDAADTSSVGAKTVSLTGYDNAGNSKNEGCAYTVGYKFVGFTSPVDNPMVLNKAKAGQAIPLKWRLLDANDDPVGNLSSVSATVASLSCSLATTADALEEYATGSSGLQNLGNGYYQWNWKSPTSYANSCKTFKLDLGEASPRTALFQFTK
jgi:hypothetical protein